MTSAARHRPRLLDLFCGAGGASAGYSDAEPTGNPHLVITPVPLPPPADDPDDDEGPQWQVVHVPTGRHLGVSWLTELDQCRALAAALVDLDWSDPNVAAYQPGGRLAGYGERVTDAATRAVQQGVHR